jgi:RNA polymerase sigma-70 factor, ECF subfamily
MDAAVFYIDAGINAGFRMSMLQQRDRTRAAPPAIAIELIERCKAGQLGAFEEVYRTYKSFLYSLAWRFHGNRFDAEDSLQEAFVAVYRNIGSFAGNAQFSSWLYRILLNTCISRKRRERTDEQKTDFSFELSHPVSADADADVMLAQMLQREIGTLPELQRAVFLLYATEGFTHEEIGETLRISPGTSKSYYHRAKETLKKKLRAAGIDEREVRP